MEQTEEQKQDELQDVSESYVVSMKVAQATLNLPSPPSEKLFVTAVHPGIHEDDISAAAVPLSYNAGAESNQARIGGIVVSGGVAPAKGFVAKCTYQIVDYAIAVQELNGDERVRRWDSSKGGDNETNRQMYVQLLQAPFRDMIEGFLDMMAGRDTDAALDFEELKNAQPQLLTTS